MSLLTTVIVLLLVLIALVICFFVGAFVGFVTGWIEALRNPPKETTEIKPIITRRAGLGLKIKVDEDKTIRIGDTSDDKPILFQWPPRFIYELQAPVVKILTRYIYIQKTKDTLEPYDWSFENGIKNNWTMRESYDHATREFPGHFETLDDSWDSFKKAMYSREKKSGERFRREES